jgi:D-alanyl-lipoteichoic acid acyltransferase DltB (MBOAT superfamily)
VVELNKFAFWALCGSAALLLAPVSSFALRKWIQAGVNVALLVFLLRLQAIGLLLGIAIAYLAIQFVGRPRYRIMFAAFVGVSTAGLFLLHKLPQIAASLGADGLVRILAVIGYSYVALRIIEVLRAVFERRHPAPDFVSLINYLLPFHMLAAGPIQSFDDFMKHAEERFEPTAKTVLIGFELIASGLFMKFVLADLLQKLFLTNFESSGLYFFLEMQLTFVWLYLDFSAYSYIALGIGMLLGISTPVNFNRPLLARNLIDFWDRWHISLSLFIRRNIFIPLQVFLMRLNDGRTPLLTAAIAIAVSFILCGLWHGLGVGFLTWGAIQAGGLIATRVYGHALQTTLGRDGLRNYLANPWFRAMAIFLTFQVQAVALLALIKL